MCAKTIMSNLTLLILYQSNILQTFLLNSNKEAWKLGTNCFLRDLWDLNDLSLTHTTFSLLNLYLF